MITGLLVSAAALMIACTCSRLLTLNAGRPYPFSAAWSSSCRIETRGIAVSVDDSARRGATAPPAARILRARGMGANRVGEGAPGERRTAFSFCATCSLSRVRERVRVRACFADAHPHPSLLPQVGEGALWRAGDGRVRAPSSQSLRARCVALDARRQHMLGILGPPALGEDLDLVKPAIPGAFHPATHEPQVDHAVAHHSAVGQKVARGDEPVADLVREKALGRTRPLDFGLEARIPPHVVNVDGDAQSVAVDIYHVWW